MFHLKGYNWRFLCLFVFPLLLMYVGIIRDFVNPSGARSRSLFLILWIILGWYLKNRHKSNSLFVSALIFSLYLSFIYILDLSNVGFDFAFLGCLLMWPIAINISCNSNISDNDLNLIGIFGGVVTNFMAFSYVGIISNPAILETLTYSARVASYNSIYYILLAMPLVFLIRKKWLILVFLIFPLNAFILSAKTTCLFTFLLIVGYFVFSTLRRYSLNRKVKIALFTLGLLYVSTFFVDFASILAGFQEDIDSGGNGRSSIANEIFYLLEEDTTFLQLLFGHGSNAVLKKIQIGAHNDFLEIIFNYGLIGLILFFVFWFYLLRQIKFLPPKSSLKQTYVMSLIVFFTTIFASKMIGTQVQMLLLSLTWGLSYSYSVKNRLD